MNSVINFMIDNFLLFVIIVILVILAVIGYMVEEARLEKLKKEYLKQAKKGVPGSEITFDNAVDKINGS